MASIKNRRDELLQAMRPRVRAINSTVDKPYVISAWMPGTLDEPNEVLLSHRPPVPITIPSDFSNSTFTCSVMPVVEDQVIDLYINNNTNIGTVTFYTASNFYSGSYYYSGSNYATVTGTPYRPYTGSNGGVFRPVNGYADLNVIEISEYKQLNIVVSGYVEPNIKNLSLTLRGNRY